MSKNIAIIIGSIRAVRIGPKVAEMVKTIVEEGAAGAAQAPKFTLVDIKDFNLPIFDEVIPPAMVPTYGEFKYQHSKNWSNEIQKYDGYIVVSAEYNFGIPGGLKNAIDYLYNAWIGKPIYIVTYGIVGGNSASDALHKTLTGMKMDVVETRPQLHFPGRDDKTPITASTQSAMGGELHEDAREAWRSGENKSKILEGLAELLKKLESKEAEKN